MKCSKCSNKVRFGDRYCVKCGAQIDRKKSQKTVMMASAAVALVLALAILLPSFAGGKGPNSNGSKPVVTEKKERKAKDSSQKTESSSATGNTVRYENGDILYIPSVDEIKWDADRCEHYYGNLLLVYTNGYLDDAQAQKLADTVNGVQVGRISGAVEAVQIMVDDTDLDGLNGMIKQLMGSKDVMFAEYEYPMEMTPSSLFSKKEKSSLADNNPWSKNSRKPQKDRGNEDDPAGNDWWAEAIGAYSAWKQTESMSLSPIKVGVIDNYFDTTHEEFGERITVLEKNEIVSDYNKVNGKEETEYGCPSHGTSVAGIIAAENNTVGIRGVADTAELVCIDYSIEKDGQAHSFTNPEFVKAHSDLLENGVKVINDSWGVDLFTEDYFKRYKKKDKDWLYAKCKNYDEYLTAFKNECYQSAQAAIKCIANAYHNHKDNEFIIVQSAGNGYNNWGKEAVEVKSGGWFCSITEGIYTDLKKEKGDYLPSYNEIKDRILVVGAVQNGKDSDGNYRTTPYSNYGSNVDICSPGGTEDYQIFHPAIGGYGSSIGTSEAAPMVSGSAALLWSINPSLTAKQVKDALLSSTTKALDPLGGSAERPSSYPMLNIGQAVEKVVKDMNIVVVLNEEEKPDYRLYIPYLEKAISEQESYDGRAILIDYDGDNVLELVFIHDNLPDTPTQRVRINNELVPQYTREMSYSIYDIENGSVVARCENRHLSTMISMTPLAILIFDDAIRFTIKHGINDGINSSVGIHIYSFEKQSEIYKATADETAKGVNPLLDAYPDEYKINGSESTKQEFNSWYNNLSFLAFLDVGDSSPNIQAKYSELPLQKDVRTLAGMIEYINSMYEIPIDPPAAEKLTSDVSDLTEKAKANDAYAFVKKVLEKTNYSILYTLCYDYDGNGKNEAFIITQEPNSSFPTSDLWFVNEDTAVMLETDNGNSELNGVFQVGSQVFFSMDRNYFGPGQWSLVYTVKGGAPVKLGVSESCGDFGVHYRDNGEPCIMGSVGDTSEGARNYRFSGYVFNETKYDFEIDPSIEHYHYESGKLCHCD